MSSPDAQIAPRTRVSELVRRVARPSYDIVRVAHVELLVADLEASRAFYGELLGMIESDRDDDVVYLRGWEDHTHHSLVLRRAAEPAVSHIAFRVREEEDLELLADAARTVGAPVQWHEHEPHHGRALRLSDPFGIPLEFFAAIEPARSRLRHFHEHRGAPVMRLDHVNLQMPDIERAIPFWAEHGFRCSEYLSTDGPDERLCGAWLFRKPNCHDVAFTAGVGPRLHHMAFWVAEPMGVLRACDHLAAAGAAPAIERGPGRHGITNAFFVYFRDPDGHRIELFSSDYFTGDPDLEPLRWSASDPTARTFWGARAPDSWYDEASRFRGHDGELVPVRDSSVDERSELLA
ncbi:MAG: 3,4-dihydroxyphenylacetate 2,3-dioxygenase [Solirubrobacterales bacterium]|nr:3,4-dihydroxyphenylacetate 2,3-dioxygenase [Solirubrobacterales bacterium]MBV9714238.1 3,4-dihydroxyphenylacetate 2,3-dioxygenase [Solirubrobacterales bacterium]